MCIWAILWDMWHSVRAYTDDISFLSKLCFSFFSLCISFLLFILTTNLASLGLPFNVFFNNLNKNTIQLIYGSLLPLIFFLSVIENNYWQKNVDKYNIIEDKDDIRLENEKDIKISYDSNINN